MSDLPVWLQLVLCGVVVLGVVLLTFGGRGRNY